MMYYKRNRLVTEALFYKLTLRAMLDGPTRKQPDIKVTLLGTGGPELTRDRMGAATLIEAGGKPLLFDAGRGVLQRLYECGVHINSVTRVILTHLHSDHIDGLPNLWITPWFLLGRSEPMKFWGPHGTRKMLVGMRDFLLPEFRLYLIGPPIPSARQRGSFSSTGCGSTYGVVASCSASRVAQYGDRVAIVGVPRCSSGNGC